MNYRKPLWIFLLLIILSFPSFTVYAEGNDFEFRVEPIFPTMQIGKEGYFHFKGKGNESVTLQAKVINDSNKDLIVSIRGLNAYSGYQGILYQEEPILEGTTITNDNFQFRNAVKAPPEIAVGPLESKVVDFTINIPSGIDGTLLGGMEFRVFKGTEELTKEGENSQLLIDQYKAINIGVQVDVANFAETPSLSLEKPLYSPEQMAMMVPMGNLQPVILRNITGKYKVTKSGDESFSLEGDIPKFNMAPMTAFYYPIRWTEGTLQSGDYHIEMTLDVNGQTQTYEQSTAINNQEIQETQDKMEERGQVEVKPKTFPWTMVIIVLLVVVIIILLFRMRKPKSQRKDRKYPGQDSNEL